MEDRARQNRALLFVLGLLLIAAAGVASLYLMRAGKLPRPRTIILISIDTCRPDRLSCYGFSRRTTPNIDALAREGFLFRHVIAPCSSTLPSHCSMLTGTIPPFHGVHNNGTYRLHEANVTLAEMLKERGYATAAVIGAFVLDSQFGLAQGFDSYDVDLGAETGGVQVLNERPAEQVSRKSIAWLEDHADERTFLFLHYFDAHFPYAPPEPFSSEWVNAPYAGEIAYADHWIGEVIAKLKELGLYDSALIMVTSDHGESLGEHGELTHGYFIYHSTTRVPLIVKLPGQCKPSTIEEKVALIDIVPTILDCAGIPISNEMQGESLTPYFTGRRHQNDGRYIYGESFVATGLGCGSVLGLETPEWKYIQSARPELYDLIRDPGETRNVLPEHERQARLLKEQLRGVLEKNLRTFSGDTYLALDDENIGRLETLGYLDSSRDAQLEFEQGGIDKKDFLPLYLRLSMANELAQRDPDALVRVPTPDGGSVEVRRREAARKLYNDVLAARPELPRAHSMLAKLAIDEGDLASANEHLTALLELHPKMAYAHERLANLRMRQGRFDEALSLYERALELVTARQSENAGMDVIMQAGEADPLVFDITINLADLLYRQGSYNEAAERYSEALRMLVLATGRTSLSEIRARAQYRLGLSLSKLGRRQEAIEAFQKTLELQPDHSQAREALDEALTSDASSLSP